ncbi:hypothetical protein Taro_006907 [Colocasia esculenta]|uniref:Uncharacterized protein n=1 Tax=Colocasia esculenta TaxID=4460 RepID=A0A843TXG3_COLES|nr:hypothetical protein [Colocasia esculenta]
MHSWQPKFVPTHPWRFLDGQDSLMEGEIFKLWKDTSQSRNPFFPCCIRTPKTHRCLNSLHPNPRDEFRTCWGRVEELLVAGDLWINHKKLIFFPHSPATTCTDSHLEVDQRQFWTAIQEHVLSLSESGADHVNATAR